MPTAPKPNLRTIGKDMREVDAAMRPLKDRLFHFTILVLLLIGAVSPFVRRDVGAITVSAICLIALAFIGVGTFRRRSKANGSDP